MIQVHPVMRSVKEHFSKDLQNAKGQTEAVIDCSGQITYYNKTGIKNPIRPDGTIEPLLDYQAAFTDASGHIIGFATVDIIDHPDGSQIVVHE